MQQCRQPAARRCGERWQPDIGDAGRKKARQGTSKHDNLPKIGVRQDAPGCRFDGQTIYVALHKKKC